MKPARDSFFISSNFPCQKPTKANNRINTGINTRGKEEGDGLEWSVFLVVVEAAQRLVVEYAVVAAVVDPEQEQSQDDDIGDDDIGYDDIGYDDIGDDNIGDDDIGDDDIVDEDIGDDDIGDDDIGDDDIGDDDISDNDIGDDDMVAMTTLVFGWGKMTLLHGEIQRCIDRRAYCACFFYINELELTVEESRLQPSCYLQAVSCMAAFFMS